MLTTSPRSPRLLAPFVPDIPSPYALVESSALASLPSLTLPPIPPIRPNTTILFPVAGSQSYPITGPLKGDAFTYLMRHYPDQGLVQSLHSICTYGASIGYTGPRVGHPFKRNLPSTPSEHAETARDIEANLSLGELRLVSDLPSPLQSLVFYSPIGSVPKSGGGSRTIHHLSHPDRHSINDGISPEAVTLVYTSLDSLLHRLRSLGRGAVVWKMDLKRAFRHIVVCPDDSILYGFYFDGIGYIDLRLPFGSRSSPFLYNLFAEAVHWIAERLGVALDHFLDDFFGAQGPDSSAVADRDRTVLRSICHAVGLSPHDIGKPGKDIPPTTKGTILGIEIDTISFTISLPSEKLHHTVTTLQNLLSSPSASLLQLQSIAGLLQFATRILPAGRAFIRRIYDATKHFSRFGRRRIPSDARRDLSWWARFLPTWNGIESIALPSSGVTIFTDASGSSNKGIGGHLGSRENSTDFFASRVPRRHRTKTILFKELWAVLHALRCWASSSWAGTLVTLRVDNTGAVDGLNGGSLRERPSQALLREIFLLALSFNFSIHCVWISSKSNYLADALSRFDMYRLRPMLPAYFDAQPTPFPHLPPTGLLGLTSLSSSPSTFGMDSPLPLEASTILPASHSSALLAANMAAPFFRPTPPLRPTSFNGWSPFPLL